MQLLFVKRYSEKGKQYIVKAVNLAALLQGQGLINDHIRVYEIPEYLTEYLTHNWKEDTWFEDISGGGPDCVGADDA